MCRRETRHRRLASILRYVIRGTFKDIEEKKRCLACVRDTSLRSIEYIVPSVENSYRNAGSRCPLDIFVYFHSGFHFLLFSVRRTLSVPLARNKTHKGAALPSISHLDFHAEKEREREVREIRPFCNFQASAGATPFRDSKGESFAGISRILSGFYPSSRSLDASITINVKTDGPCE